MEEILASIRRIISEDEPGAEAAPAAEAAEAAEPVALAPEPEPEPEPEPAAAVVEAVEAVEAEDVLELTEPLPEPEAEPEPVAVETLGDIEVHEAAPAPEPVALAPVADDEPLVSEPIADRSASAFGHLARSIAMPAQGRSLEDVVRELLNPLLKAWLDEHLTTIVQAKVEEEVERIARRRVRD